MLTVFVVTFLISLVTVGGAAWLRRTRDFEDMPWYLAVLMSFCIFPFTVAFGLAAIGVLCSLIWNYPLEVFMAFLGVGLPVLIVMGFVKGLPKVPTIGFPWKAFKMLVTPAKKEIEVSKEPVYRSVNDLLNNMLLMFALACGLTLSVAFGARLLQRWDTIMPLGFAIMFSVLGNCVLGLILSLVIPLVIAFPFQGLAVIGGIVVASLIIRVSAKGLPKFSSKALPLEIRLFMKDKFERMAVRLEGKKETDKITTTQPVYRSVNDLFEQ